MSRKGGWVKSNEAGRGKAAYKAGNRDGGKLKKRECLPPGRYLV